MHILVFYCKAARRSQFRQKIIKGLNIAPENYFFAGTTVVLTFVYITNISNENTLTTKVLAHSLDNDFLYKYFGNWTHNRFKNLSWNWYDNYLVQCCWQKGLFYLHFVFIPNWFPITSTNINRANNFRHMFFLIIKTTFESF